MNIKIDPEFRDLIPPLTEDEYKGLESSILEDGIRESIYIWDETIVDGHNRYEISQKHNLPCPTKNKLFSNREDAKIWIIDNQRGRRNLSKEQMLSLGVKRIEISEVRAKENLKKAGTMYGENHPKEEGYPILDKALTPINTTKELADFAGVGYGTASKYKQIQNSDNEEVKEKVKNGELTIGGAYQEIKKPAKGILSYYPPDEEEEVVIELGSKEWEKESNQKLEMSIVDEAFKSFKVRLISTKSIKMKIKKIKALIKKLSDWCEQLEESLTGDKS